MDGEDEAKTEGGITLFSHFVGFGEAGTDFGAVWYYIFVDTLRWNELLAQTPNSPKASSEKKYRQVKSGCQKNSDPRTKPELPEPNKLPQASPGTKGGTKCRARPARG